jgi:hypothetical protein
MSSHEGSPSILTIKSDKELCDAVVFYASSMNLKSAIRQRIEAILQQQFGQGQPYDIYSRELQEALTQVRREVDTATDEFMQYA